MDTQDIRIRAKKISELQNFDLTPDENSYIIIGYNNGESKQNYKMSLVGLINLISNMGPQGGAIDDATLIAKINQFISTDAIELPTIAGPQGPQGPKGDSGDSGSIDLDNIQNQIDELRELIERNHQTYNITYNLTNVSSISSNPNSIGYDKSLTLYFIPNTGYIMPNNITVSNCQYVYDKENKSLLISNATGDVNISITGELGHYTLTKSFENIIATPIVNEYQSYVKGTSISYTLTVESNAYKLPSTIEATNCTVQYTPNNDFSSALLSITCTGEGNMSVSASAISNITYYFGIISVDNTTNDKIEITWSYDRDNIINGILSVNIKNTNWMTSNTSCPFIINSNITLSNDVHLGSETVVIVPEEFYNPLTYTFTDGTNTGKLRYGSSPFPFESDIYNRILINNVGYYCISLQEGLSANNTLVIN